MALQYRTRAGEEGHLQNKLRVYVACHPQDVSLYLDGMISDILAISDCVVYYRDGAKCEIDEEYYGELAQMNVFVLAVTSRFLLTENAARCTDFAYAKQYVVPILPLAQEPMLEPLFNETCGYYHVLDKHGSDDTRIPYDKKLKDFFALLEVGDLLSKRVQQAFMGHVFLSYRKKDRLHAQRLMRRIHNHPDFRDLAIWYDEFLVPGENFNDAISKEIESSDAFVLSVTPNLLEQGNYVLTTEYPHAKNLNKTMLFAELLPVDDQAFRRAFLADARLVSAFDEDEMEQALQEIFQGRVCRIDNDPLHVYLIGIAYLYGINVEVDHARAAALIEQAANARLPEAMEKLACMYRIGEGVAQNYFTGIEWLSRLCEELEREYGHQNSEQNALSYLYGLSLLCGAYTELEQYEKAEPTYRRYCSAATEVSSRYASQDALEHLVKSCEMLSLVDTTSPASYRYLQKAVQTREQMESAESTAAALFELGRLYLMLGEHFALQDSAVKKAYYERAISSYEQSYAKEASGKCLIALARAAGRYAVDFAANRQVQAYAWELYDRLAEHSEDLMIRLECVAFYRDLFRAYMLTDQDYEPEFFAGKLQKLTISPCEQPVQMHERMLYFRVLYSIAQGSLDVYLPSTEEYLHAAKNLGRELAEQSDSRYVRAMLGDLYDELAYLALTKRELFEAKQYFLREAEVLDALQREYPNMLSATQLGFVYTKLAEIAESLGDDAAYGHYIALAKAFEDDCGDDLFDISWDE